MRVHSPWFTATNLLLYFFVLFFFRFVRCSLLSCALIFAICKNTWVQMMWYICAHILCYTMPSNLSELNPQWYAHRIKIWNRAKDWEKLRFYFGYYKRGFARFLCFILLMLFFFCAILCVCSETHKLKRYNETILDNNGSKQQHVSTKHSLEICQQWKFINALKLETIF